MNPDEFTKECREMIETPVADQDWTQLAEYTIWLEVKLERACTIIDECVPVCPNCGNSDLEIRVDKENFGRTDIFVPIHSCKQCNFQWTDDIGGTVWDKNKELFKFQLVELRDEKNKLNELALRYKKESAERLDRLQDLHMSNSALRDVLALQLGIDTELESWWDASEEEKDKQILVVVKKLKNKGEDNDS